MDHRAITSARLHFISWTQPINKLVSGENDYQELFDLGSWATKTLIDNPCSTATINLLSLRYCGTN
jgi:hypothetical protein